MAIYDDELNTLSEDEFRLYRDDLQKIILKASEKNALNEWREYIQKADMLYSILRANTRSGLFQKTYEAWKAWPSLSKAQKIDVLMLLSETLARIFNIPDPHLYTKQTWKIELLDHSSDLFEETEGFYYRLDGERPAIVLDDHYLSTEENFGNVFYLFVHEFGHAVSDMLMLSFYDQLARYRPQEDLTHHASEQPLALFLSLIMNQEMEETSDGVNPLASPEAYSEYKSSLHEQSADFFAMKVRDRLWQCMWNVKAVQTQIARYELLSREMSQLLSQLRECPGSEDLLSNNLPFRQNHDFQWRNQQEFLEDLPALLDLMDQLESFLEEQYFASSEDEARYKLKALKHHVDALSAWMFTLEQDSGD